MEEKQRLIDANDLVRCCEFAKSKLADNDSLTALDLLIKALKQAPTVDAVEVVRCKDCKHWHEETGWCTQHSHFIGRDGMACHPSQSSEWKMFNADDFCSYGERREGE